MKKFVMLFAGLFLAMQGIAQYTLQGRVEDENGEPLAGANVRIAGTYLGASTDHAGGFRFKGLSRSELSLEVSFLGYEKLRRHINLKKTKKTTLQLTPKSVLADEVLVQATRAGADDPVAQTTLENETLSGQNMARDVPYVLSLAPSVVATSEAGTGMGYTHLRIRGTDPTRVNVTLNGVPLNDAESQGVFWVNTPDLTASVNNVQVQRGVGTSTNGAGAFGGTINFQTFEKHEKPYAGAFAAAGSFGTFKNRVEAGTGLIDGRFSVDARYSNLQTDGYIDHSFSDHEALFLTAAYYGDNSLLKAHVFTGNERTGISWWGVPQEVLDEDRTYNPAGQYTDFHGNPRYYDDQTDNYEQTHYQLHFAHNFTNRFNANIALHYTRGDGFYEQYKADEAFADYGLQPISLGSTTYQIGGETRVFPDSTISSTDLVRRKFLDNHFYGLTYAANYQQGRLKATLGGAYSFYDGDHFGDVLWSQYGGAFTKDYRWYDNVGRKTDGNVYAKLNYALTPALSAYADAQYRYIHYEMQGKDDDLLPLDQTHTYNFFNPKFGLFYKPTTNQDLYASVAVAHREPTRTNFKDAKGDPAATPQQEKLVDYELGYEWRSMKSAFSVNLFYMDYTDQLVPTGEKNNVGSDIMTNVPASYRRGLELIVGVKPATWLNWNGNLTLSQNQIKNFVSYADHYTVSETAFDYEGHLPSDLGQTHIAYSPEITGSGQLQFKLDDAWKLQLVSRYVGEQYFDNTSSEARKLEAYFVNDLMASYRFSAWQFEQIRLRLAVNNLLDAQYESNAYGGHWYENDKQKTWAYYYPQAGINFMFSVDIKL